MTSTPVRTTWRQALAWRLDRHLLDPVGPATATEVVKRLGALLSMDASLADLAVVARSTTARPGDLAEAVRYGSVVTVFAFRGSMHHLAAEDAGTYLALRAAGRQWERTSWVEYYRLTPQDWPAFRAAVREALADGPLTIGELGSAVTRRREYAHLAGAFEDGAGTLLKPLTWQGDMVLGPVRDGRRTVQRVDDGPRWGGIPPLDEAGPRAVEAYLRTYGPATPDHVHHWLGKGLSAGSRRLERWWDGLADRRVPVDVEGTTAWVMADDADGLAAAEPTDRVTLLPGHDQWVMGIGTSDEHVTPPRLRQDVTRKANLLLVGGVVRGTWRLERDDVTLRWAGPGARPDDAVTREVARLASALDRPLRPRWTD